MAETKMAIYFNVSYDAIMTSLLLFMTKELLEIRISSNTYLLPLHIVACTSILHGKVDEIRFYPKQMK